MTEQAYLNLKKRRIWIVGITASLCVLMVFANACGPGFSAIATTESLSSVTGETKMCATGMYQQGGMYRRNSQMIRNGLTDLFGTAFASKLAAAFANLPPDASGEFTYERIGMSTNSAQVQSYADLANSVGQSFVADPVVSAKFLPAGCLVSAVLTAPCLDGLTQKLIPLLTSRPANTEEIIAVKAIYADTPGTNQEKLANALSLIFLTPDLHYQSLSGADKNYLAARELARTTWASFPDQVLLDRAKAGQLSTAEAIKEETSRMLKDPRSRRLVRSFAEQWLELDELDSLANYSSSFLNGLAVPGTLRDAMTEEVLSFFEYIVFENRGTYSDLLLSRGAKIASASLAAVYGTTTSNTWVQLPGDRAGILTRAALLATGNNETNSILRGVRVTRDILCNPIPDPSTDLIDMRPIGVVRTDHSTRSYTEIRTSGSACIGCHSAINPFGHSLGGFDSIGRVIGQDRIFNDTGTYVRAFPVDAQSTIPLDDSRRAISDGVKLSQAIAYSHQGAECFSRQVYRFMSGRQEPAAGSCGIHAASKMLKADTPIIDVLASWIETEVNGLVASNRN